MISQAGEARRALRLRGYDSNAAAELLLGGGGGAEVEMGDAAGDGGDEASSGDDEGGAAAQAAGAADAAAAAGAAGGAAGAGAAAAAAGAAAAETEPAEPLDAEMVRAREKQKAPTATPLSAHVPSPRRPAPHPSPPLRHTLRAFRVALPTAAALYPSAQESELAQGVSADPLAHYDVSVAAEGAPHLTPPASAALVHTFSDSALVPLP